MTSITETESIKPDTELVLQYLVRPAGIEAGARKAIVLLHGVGSNEKDLFSLAPFIPENYTFISARAPFILGTDRYAWYQVDFSSGKPEINAAQEAQSRSILHKFIAQLREKYKLDEIYLGGFSQGAIMSYTLGLTNPTEVTGIAAFSGRLLTEIRPLVKPGAELQKLKVFIAHGTQDGTLPVQYAREAKAYLETLNIIPTYLETEMGHQISNEVVEGFINWLNGIPSK